MAKRYRYKGNNKAVPMWVVALGVLGVYFMLMEGKFVSIELE